MTVCVGGRQGIAAILSDSCRKVGAILARSGDAAALQAALAEDPFVAHGAARFELIEFTPSMTAAGAEALKSL